MMPLFAYPCFPHSSSVCMPLALRWLWSLCMPSLVTLCLPCQLPVCAERSKQSYSLLCPGLQYRLCSQAHPIMPRSLTSIRCCVWCSQVLHCFHSPQLLCCAAVKALRWHSTPLGGPPVPCLSCPLHLLAPVQHSWSLMFVDEQTCAEFCKHVFMCVWLTSQDRWVPCGLCNGTLPATPHQATPRHHHTTNPGSAPAAPPFAPRATEAGVFPLTVPAEGSPLMHGDSARVSMAGHMVDDGAQGNKPSIQVFCTMSPCTLHYIGSSQPGT